MTATILAQQARQCARLIQTAEHIAALTGAGISTAAGIPDFRGPQGLYVTQKYDADKIFDINYFYRDPGPFYEFARDFVQLEERIQPTAAHYFLADLEGEGKLKGIITQNIDALHQRAGSRNVLEMHGSIWESFCLDCGQKFSYTQMKEKVLMEKVAHCRCQGVIKPDIVFFGENVKHYETAVNLTRQADLFFVIGTSCVVNPAALLPTLTRGEVIVVNQDAVDLPGGNVALEVQEDMNVFFRQVAELL